MNPKWLNTANSLIGTKEIKGVSTNPEISKWLKELNAWWSDDETPWCGVFVAYCMKVSGIALPKNWMRAKAWSEWGVPLIKPVIGCIVVFERDGGGHVGFVVGKTSTGNILVLGGNQNDQVKASEFKSKDQAENRVVGYYWPEGISVPIEDLPILSSDGKLSTNES